MKRLFFPLITFLMILPGLSLIAQTEDSTDVINDSLAIVNEPVRDTLSLNDSLKKVFLNDPVRLKIIEFIKTVNEKSASVDLIHSENVVKIKASSIDQAGDMEIKVKRNDDIWFRVSGNFAMISKDAFIAHFNRKNFIYFDNLNDKVIEGPTTDDNIGYISRIKCSFDDLMNVMSGTCSIVYTDADTITMETEKTNNVITVRNGKKYVKYWVDAAGFNVVKYAYFNRKLKQNLSIMYGNFVKAGNGFYARKVEINRPLSSEYLRIFNETYSLNNPGMSFKVDYPTDVRRVKW